MLVELLERRDRDVDVVLVEAEEARRIVHQHVRIEHEELLHLGLSRGAGRFHGRERRRTINGGLLDIIGL